MDVLQLIGSILGAVSTPLAVVFGFLLNRQRLLLKEIESRHHSRAMDDERTDANTKLAIRTLQRLLDQEREERRQQESVCNARIEAMGKVLEAKQAANDSLRVELLEVSEQCARMEGQVAEATRQYEMYKKMLNEEMQNLRKRVSMAEEKVKNGG